MGSKRVRFPERTLRDLRRVSREVNRACKVLDDAEPLKGTIYLKDAQGQEANIEIYYTEECPHAGLIQYNDSGEMLEDVYIVTNPDYCIQQTEKGVYYALYHELQHIIDLNVLRYRKNYDSYHNEIPEQYFGHEYEFRAYTNEILEGIVNEYKRLAKEHSKEEVLDAADSLLRFFGQDGIGGELNRKVLFRITSERPNKKKTPYTLQVLALIKEHNPRRWKYFLKMLYSTVEEIKEEVVGSN